LTISGCCDKLNIVTETKYIYLNHFGFKVRIVYCSGCGSLKSTSHVKEHKIMAGSTLFAEKAGQRLKAEYFETDNGAGVRFFINEEFVKEEVYADGTLGSAKALAENWIDSIKVLNG
jgi:hypothetical protein